MSWLTSSRSQNKPLEGDPGPTFLSYERETERSPRLPPFLSIPWICCITACAADGSFEKVSLGETGQSSFTEIYRERKKQNKKQIKL